ASGAATSGIPASAAASGISTTSSGPTPPVLDDASTRAALRARWEALADSINDAEELDDSMIESIEEPDPLPPVTGQSRRGTDPGVGNGHQRWPQNPTDDLGGGEWPAPPREPTLIIRDPGPPSAEEQGSWPIRVTQPEPSIPPVASRLDAPPARDSID